VNEGERRQMADGRWITIIREVWDGDQLLEVAYRIDGETDEHRVYFTPAPPR
jgi:hypothetical protein